MNGYATRMTALATLAALAAGCDASNWTGTRAGQRKLPPPPPSRYIMDEASEEDLDRLLREVLEVAEGLRSVPDPETGEWRPPTDLERKRARALFHNLRASKLYHEIIYENHPFIGPIMRRLGPLSPFRGISRQFEEAREKGWLPQTWQLEALGVGRDPEGFVRRTDPTLTEAIVEDAPGYAVDALAMMAFGLILRAGALILRRRKRPS